MCEVNLLVLTRYLSFGLVSGKRWGHFEGTLGRGMKASKTLTDYVLEVCGHLVTNDQGLKEFKEGPTSYMEGVMCGG